MKRRLVSMCLAVMLVGGLSVSSMQEVRAAGNKVIDGSELTHDEESIGYDTKITRGEDLMTGYSKCTKLAKGKIYVGAFYKYCNLYTIYHMSCDRCPTNIYLT